MIRQTVAHIDLAAIRQTSARFRSSFRQRRDKSRTSGIGHRTWTSDIGHRASAAAPRRDAPRVIAVVKANAYGHGASEVGLALERAGAAMLACADIEEGILLRRAGLRIPILVFGALGISDLDGVFEFDLTPTISTPTAAENLARAAARWFRRPPGVAGQGQTRVKPGSDRGQTRVRPPVPGTQISERRTALRCHLKIDTGMNRLGFRHDNLARTLPAIAKSEYLAIDAVYTHFATADEPEHPAFNEQRERFQRVLTELPSLGITPNYRHAANSAALLRDERVWYDFVRPGLLLYGIVPPPLATTIPLRPALSLHPYRAREGDAGGRGHRLRPARGQRHAAHHRGRPCRLRRRPRPPHVGPRLHAGTRKTRTRRRLRVHGHDDDRRDGARGVNRR
jgi:hypothetical protein